MGILKTISITNFRNYAALNLELRPGINVLLGENGQGKTSLLEAIYFLSTLRSFRSQQVKSLFRWGQKSFSIRGVVGNDTVPTTIEIHYGEKRKLSINGSNVYKTSELLGKLLCIAFVPEDLNLVRGSGIDRRRFLDTALSLLDPQYLCLLQDYNKALKSRNLLLKRTQPDQGLIESFDTILIRTGARISFYRSQFCRELEEFINEFSSSLFSKKHDLKLSYDYSYQPNGSLHSLAEIEQALGSAFRQNLSRDMDYQLTHIGPHRENFTLFLNQKNLQNYGSEGQCRLAVLIMKMATGELFLRERKDDAVIFLVDDVTGELDKNHKKLFLKLLDRTGQVLFVCTDDTILSEINSSIIFEIRKGTANIRNNKIKSNLNP